MNSKGSRQTWVTVGIVAAATTGCQTTSPPSTATDASVRSDVTDIRPMSHSMADAAPAYEPVQFDTSGVIPVASQPLTEPSPVKASATLAPTPVVFADGPAPTVKPAVATARTHTVRRGETWYAIARSTYGDGSQWHRLAAANPAVAAAGPLKVGQKLLVP